VTTINGGSTWAHAISALCDFYPEETTTKGCPYAGSPNTQGVVTSVQIAVDPNVSPLLGDAGATTFHDVWLWITTTNPPQGAGGRYGFFYEFYVDASGNVSQLQAGPTGGGTWPSPLNGAVSPYLCQGSNGCNANADTLTMVVGKEKQCINDNNPAPFLFFAWASYNPLADALCAPGDTTTNPITWQGLGILNQDTGTSATYQNNSNLFGTSYTEPDCVGYQVNWPGVALAYDDTPTSGAGGGGSVTMALSIPGPNGQIIGTWTTSPIGCTPTIGTECVDCCNTGGAWGCGPGGEAGPATSPPACTYSTPGGQVVSDCTSAGCVDAGSGCTALGGAQQVLPALAFQANADAGVPAPDLTLAWYDNRDGTDGGSGTLSFGEIRAQSAGGANGEFPQEFPATSTQVVPYSGEGTGSTVAPMNQCIGLAVQNESSHWFGANNGNATIFNWQYVN
jgi:hypothetical protein